MMASSHPGPRSGLASERVAALGTLTYFKSERAMKPTTSQRPGPNELSPRQPRYSPPLTASEVLRQVAASRAQMAKSDDSRPISPTGPGPNEVSPRPRRYWPPVTANEMLKQALASRDQKKKSDDSRPSVESMPTLTSSPLMLYFPWKGSECWRWRFQFRV